MVGNIRRYIKTQNQTNSYLWLRAVWRFLRDFWESYPFWRFANFLHFFFLVNVKGRIPLKIDKRIMNGVFYICLDKSSEQIWVIKIPRLNSVHSSLLFKKILVRRNFVEYSNMIKAASTDPVLGKHFPPVRDIKRNGGYSSLYIEGYNLVTLRDDLRAGYDLPQDLDYSDLIKAVKELLDSLGKFAQQNGRIYGDWALHNLLYDKLTQKIKNVDLEGFYMDRQDQLQADAGYVKGMLETLIHEFSHHSQAECGTRNSRARSNELLAWPSGIS